MLVALMEWISGLWGPTEPEAQLARDTRKRAERAYAAAWSVRIRTKEVDDALLLQELRARNVPGSFSNASADPMLSGYFDAWRAGKDQKAVRAESAKQRH